MSEYDLPNFDPEPEERQGLRLPFGLSAQALAAILLVIALLAILYLFFGPTPDAPADLPTATPRPTPSQVAGDVAGPDEDAGAGAVDAGADAAGTPGSTELGAASTGEPEDTGGSDEGAGNEGSDPAPPLATSTSAASSLPATSPSGMQSALGPGSFASVTDTDGFGLRLRFGPGFDYATIRIVPDGNLLEVIGEPEEGEGYTWYRLRDELGNVGWGAVDFLSPTAAPAMWSPPQASPTFQAEPEAEATESG